MKNSVPSEQDWLQLGITWILLAENVASIVPSSWPTRSDPDPTHWATAWGKIWTRSDFMDSTHVQLRSREPIQTFKRFITANLGLFIQHDAELSPVQSEHIQLNPTLSSVQLRLSPIESDRTKPNWTELPVASSPGQRPKNRILNIVTQLKSKYVMDVEFSSLQFVRLVLGMRAFKRLHDNYRLNV